MFGPLGFLIGIALLILGVLLIIFFPAAQEYQSETFSLTAIVMGIIFIIIGGILVLM